MQGSGCRIQDFLRRGGAIFALGCDGFGFGAGVFAICKGLGIEMQVKVSMRALLPKIQHASLKHWTRTSNRPFHSQARPSDWPTSACLAPRCTGL